MKAKYTLFLLAFLLSGCSAQQPNLNIPAEGWRSDLEVVRNELPRKHINAFHAVTRESFDSAIGELESHVTEQDPDKRFVGLFRVLNMIGDGHTSARPPSDRAYFPLDIREFGEELRVARTDSEHRQALGARVLAIDGHPVQTVVKDALELTPSDENVSLRHALSSNYLSIGLILHGFGAIAARDHATYTLQDDSGRKFDVQVTSVALKESIRWITQNQEAALAQQHADDPFWCTSVTNSSAVYCNFRSYDHLGSHAREMFNLFRSSHANKLIIDLRQNGGGDYTVGEKELIRPIQRSPDVNQKGRLFVLIGPGTFSAAMNNAAQFQSMTAATTVGDTIGEKPNSYQEPREFTLPNSHLVVRYSTRWYAFKEGGPNEISPDVRIRPTWVQYAAGIDPVLQYCLRPPVE